MFRALFISFRRSWKLVFPFTYKSKKSIFFTSLTVFLVVGSSVSSSLLPHAIGYLSEYHKILSSYYIMIGICGIVVLWSAESLISHINSILFYAVTNKAIRDIRLDVILHIHKKSHSQKNQFDSSEIVSANDRIPMAVVNFMGKIFIHFIPSLLTFLSVSLSIGLMIQSGWIYVVAVYMTFFPTIWLVKKYIVSRYDVWRNSDNVRVMQMESLKSLIASSLSFESEVPRLHEAFDLEQKSWFTNNAHEYLVHIVQEALFFIISGIFLFYVISNNQKGLISQESVFSYIAAIPLLYRNLHSITCHAKGLFSSVIDMDKVINILDTPVNVIDKNLSQAYNSKLNDKITFTNVSFWHAGHNPIIHNCSLEIKIGDKIIISGESGAGKSTLCKLLSAVYKPSKGDVEIFGQNTKGVDIDNLPPGIENISQDSTLYNASIEANLNLYGKAPELFTNFFKDRLFEQILDYGRNLSNGERQRILLARSLAKPLQMIVLDETFNSLDQASSIMYLEYIFERVPTVILVTHQNSMTHLFKKELVISKENILFRSIQ